MYGRIMSGTTKKDRTMYYRGQPDTRRHDGPWLRTLREETGCRGNRGVLRRRQAPQVNSQFATGDPRRANCEPRTANMLFSSRVPRHLQPNAMFRALERAKAESRPLLDLTATNPTTAGFEYPKTLLESFLAPGAAIYEPSPLGHASARAAVARDYARRGVAVSADRIVLTSSTSEAYSLLFKLLCEPSGDDVLVPVPSYPLFEHLTRLDGVRPVQYRLEYHGRWMVDRDTVSASWTPHTRAVLAVSPNNPTGSWLSRGDFDALCERCASRAGAMIVDEVFADYPLAPDHGEPPITNPPCLTFRLGGLSKSAGLPHVKLGWIAVDGPAEAAHSALERLEFICDAYLSVSTPVQSAAARLMEDAAVVREQIAARVRSNYGRLRELAARHPAVEVLNADAGWSAVVRVPSRTSEEELVLELLERDDVVVHPGFFFDFPHESFLVVSLLLSPDVFEEGLTRLMTRVSGERI